MLASAILKAIPVWCCILVFAVANGGFREAVLLPKLGSPTALIVSGLLLSFVIVGVAYLALPWLGVRRPLHLLTVGLLWLALTLVFEFSFGLWQGKSWETLLEAYTFRDGNIWSLVLAVVAFAPLIAAKLRGWG
ncbi:hypothetical protein SAMN05660653_03198 [Desulfonatronum thiosulfatophilum]|uniref:Uncharacterized protein n=1 Tax=Desulfonatronum thiosulfatophilum TaxID=617002 RepID=A0A1G6EVM7_9BACT|nr:hypothetical protein [Desulfonatronum thiosulfatophilum]SDB61458.1 hypothetical protein SAMN05660653_03198 [Desulfonatronum thiosulfatophilum]